MPFVSVTRLRIRTFRFLPFFGIHTTRTIAQVKAAPGFVCGSLLPDRRFTFWTLTVWDSQQSMRNYMTSGAHKTAMPKLMHWCDEASVTHWDQPESDLPTWTEADRRMRNEGRASKVAHPSPSHAGLNYETPSVSRAAPAFYPKTSSSK
jgi:hypothetical protein